MTDNNIQNSYNETPYDETPYDSYPYAQSSPEKLATIGTLFGMNPPNIETARVLELGSAEGGNIIPHAVHYPKGYYVGVDLSKKQIDSGLEIIKSLGLKNIELKHCSITDIDESFGKFDYIICHGVISWVPDFVKEKIFEIANKNLSENGIAYISYNTLPGWNMVRTIREMMLYHSKDFASTDKVSQARALLNFVKESLEGSNIPYAKVLKQEAELLANQGDHYIRHEHLEDENKQFYFNEFMQKAAKHKMQYVGDASISSMYLGNMGESIASKLQGINDIVRTEQYMDFINNRRFRSTLLCHNNVKLNRSLNNEDVRKFALSLDITPEKELAGVDLESNEVLKFFFKGNKDQNISTSSPWLKAIFYVFIENKGYPLAFKTIVEKASKKFKDNRSSQIEIDLLANAMNLIMKGYIEISLNSIDREQVKIHKPKITKIAQYQAEKPNNNWITNLSHMPIAITVFDKFALKYMDGKNTKEQILDHLIDDVKNGKITLHKDQQKMEIESEIKKELSVHLDNTIERLSMQGVFH